MARTGTERGEYAVRVWEDTYSAGQAAKLLGITDRWVRKMIERGELEAERDPDTGYWRIDQANVHALLEQNRQKDSLEAENIPEGEAELLQRVFVLERELGRLQGRLQLTEQAESTREEERSRLIEDLERERNRSDRLEAELAEAKRPWWKKLFGVREDQ